MTTAWNLLPDASIFDTVDISRISGNASKEVKQFVGDVQNFIMAHRAKGLTSAGFSEDIQKRLRVTEVSCVKKAEEPSKMEGRVVMEVEVQEDMVNGGANLHGGCAAFLIDVSSCMGIVAMDAMNGKPLALNVSQAINIVFHSPAPIGTNLRIINSTLTVGAKAKSVRTEVRGDQADEGHISQNNFTKLWSTTHRKLVATSTHLLMAVEPPRKPKL